MWSLVKADHLFQSPRRRGSAFLWAVPESRWNPQPRVHLREAYLSSSTVASGSDEFPIVGGVQASGSGIHGGDSPLLVCAWHSEVSVELTMEPSLPPATPRPS